MKYSAEGLISDGGDAFCYDGGSDVLSEVGCRSVGATVDELHFIHRLIHRGGWEEKVLSPR